jgi:nicotinamidase-related amidase
MASPNSDLHGSVPEDHPVALLLIDVISDFEFEGADKLLRTAVAAAKNVARLRTRTRAHRIPTVYVNDNFGRWTSDRDRIVEHCLSDGVRGEQITRMLTPGNDDYFVVKPKHSGFFGTTLELLLRYLRAKTLILAGFTTDVCVTFTANDAYMREYEIFVPSDCCAAIQPRDHQNALNTMARVLRADIRSSEEINCEALYRRTRAGRSHGG